MTAPPLLDPGFTIPEMARLWTTASRVDAILAFEAALALALGDADLAPPEQSKAVAEACAQPLDDPDGAWGSTWERGTPLLAILEEVSRRLPGEDERRWLHHGATTQDAVDTAHMMQAVSSLSLLETGLVAIARQMLPLMEDHRHQPEMGRTFLQHARPTTFGFRVALWLDALLGHIEEMRAVRSRLPVQLGGPVGDRSDYGAASQQVVDGLARSLGLTSTPLSWHANRSPVWTLVAAVDRMVRSLAKVATDVALLASSDIAEVSVRSGGSSSMPDKANPVDAIRALAAADACRGAVAMIDGARPHELDRGLGSWHVEWLALPLLFQTAAAVVVSVEGLFSEMVVETESMSAVAAPAETALAALDEQIDGVATRFNTLLRGG